MKINNYLIIFLLLILILSLILIILKENRIEHFQNNTNTVIALCANMGYFDRASKTIEEIRNVGKYNGDIVFFYNKEFTDTNKLKLLESKYKVILKEFPTIDTSSIIKYLDSHPKSEFERLRNKMIQYHKFYMFDVYFKQWDKLLYIDSGMHIYNSLDRIFNIEPAQYLFAHSDTYPDYTNKFDSQFDKNNKYFNTLQNKYNLKKEEYFQSTIILFNTNIIKDNTLSNLINLINTYPIGNGDQAYINLEFIDNWKPMPIKDDKGFLYDFMIRENYNTNHYVMLKYPQL